MGRDEEKWMNPEPYRFDLVPPTILMEMATVMGRGTRDHSPDGWRKIGVPTHVGRAMGHLVRWMRQEVGEDHLAHAACRLAFALELEREARLSPLASLEVMRGDSHPYSDPTPSVQPQGCSGPPRGWSGVGSDPLQEFRRRSPFVYLAYPYKDDPLFNTEYAIRLGRKLQHQMNQGNTEGFLPTYVLIPHLFCQHMDERRERLTIMRMCREMVGICRRLCVGHTPMSSGMKEELEEARRLGVPTFMVHDHGHTLTFSPLEGEE
jgi:hypothetical protein